MTKRFFLFLFVGVIALAVGVTIFLPFADRLSQKEWWERELQETTGRAVTIDGDVQINFFPTPFLRLQSVHFAGGVSVGQLEAYLDPLGLIAGQTAISSLTLRDMHAPLNLELFANIPTEALPSVMLENADFSLANSDVITVLSANIRQGTGKNILNAEGNIRWREQVIRLTGGLGKSSKTADVTSQSLNFALSSPLIRARYAGVLNSDFQLQGKFEVGFPDVGPLQELVGGEKVSGLQEIRLAGDIVLNAQGATWSNILIQAGTFPGTGSVRLSFEDRPKVNLEIDLPYLDMKLPSPPLLFLNKIMDQAKRVSGLSVPFDVAASVHVGSVALPYGLIQDIQIKAESTTNGVRFHQLSAVLPGGSPISAVGELRGEALDLTMEASSDDARLLLEWIGTDTSKIPSGRFHRLWMRTRMLLTSEQLTLSPLTIEMDTIHAESSLVVSLAKRPAFGLSFVIDSLPVDAYLPTPLPVGQVLEYADMLTDTDFNIKGKIGNLSHGPFSSQGVALDATTRNGELFWKISSSPSISQEAEVHSEGNVVFAKKQSPRIISSSFDVRLPTPLSSFIPSRISFPLIDVPLGTFAFGGTVQGTLDNLELTTNSEIGGLQLRGRGKVDVTHIPARFDGTVTATHANLPQMATLFGLSYPKGGPGGFALSAHATRKSEKIDFSDLRVRLGPVTLAGEAALTYLGQNEPPFLSATLHAGEIPLSLFAPSALSPSTVPLGDWIGAPSARAPHWSPDHAFSAVSLFDFPFSPYLSLHMTVDGEGISSQHVRIPTPRITFRSTENNASLTLSSDMIFGGRGEVMLEVGRTEQTHLSGRIMLSELNAHHLGLNVGGLSCVEGTLDFQAGVEGDGKNVAEAFGALSGDGLVHIRNAVIDGINLSALNSIVAPQQTAAVPVGAVFSGKSAFPEVEGQLSLTGSILGVSAIFPAIGAADGFLSGHVTFEEMALDATLTLRLPQKADAPPLALILRGSLDAPKRTLDTWAFERWGAARQSLEAATGSMKRARP